jgi:protein-export membrane protein SecD
MIENARRQLFLVVLALIAGVICQFAFTTQWGQDLKGGSQLRYEIPKDILDKLTERDGTPLDAVMDQTIAVIRDRIDPTGTIDVPVTRSGETGILMELPYYEDPQELRRIQERIANLGKLEMRMVADRLYFKPATDTQPEIRFQNLQNEKTRLEAWLKQPGVLAMLRENPREISRFNDDPVAGPELFGKLAWYPRLINQNKDNPDAWDTPYSQIPQLSEATVKAYEDKDWNNGLIPEELKDGPAKNRFLVELIAINMHERHFTGEDLDPAGVQGETSRDGGLAVGYRIVAEKQGDYADWSATYINKCSAIILNGVVKSAPRFEGRIPGVGQITGDFTKEEVDELVKVLRTGSLRVEPELVSTLIIGPTLGAESIWRGSMSLVIGGVLCLRVHGLVLRRRWPHRLHHADHERVPAVVLDAVHAGHDHAAGPWRHRADDGHGGRRQRADLRTHPRRNRQRQGPAARRASRLRARDVRDPRLQHHHLPGRPGAVQCRCWPGARLCRHADGRHRDHGLHAVPGHAACCSTTPWNANT